MTDPRFDPAFQRGYSGPAPKLVVRPAAPATQASAVAAPDVQPPLESVSPVTLPADDIAPAEPETWTSPRRNPFGIALLVVGVTMIVVSAWLMRSYTDTVINGNSQQSLQQQAAVLFQQQVAPALMLGGIAAIVAWLVVGALPRLVSKARA